MLNDHVHRAACVLFDSGISEVDFVAPVVEFDIEEAVEFPQESSHTLGLRGGIWGFTVNHLEVSHCLLSSKIEV